MAQQIRVERHGPTNYMVSVLTDGKMTSGSNTMPSRAKAERVAKMYQVGRLADAEIFFQDFRTVRNGGIYHDYSED